MGTYWKPINLDKCEEAHPQRIGDGLKWCEWVNDTEGENPRETFRDGRVSATRRWVHKLIEVGHWSADDEIRIVSDAGGSVAWLGRQTDRAADYDAPEFPDEHGGHHEWFDAPHPDTLKAPAPTLVPTDEEPLVMPADAPVFEPGNVEDINVRTVYYQPKAEPIPHPIERQRHNFIRQLPGALPGLTDDEPPASVEELLASHPGPWRIEDGPGQREVRVFDPLGQTVAVLWAEHFAAAQLLVIARETPFYTPTSGLGGGE